MSLENSLNLIADFNHLGSLTEARAVHLLFWMVRPRPGVIANLLPFKTITRYQHFVYPASHHTCNFPRYKYLSNLSVTTIISHRAKQTNYRPIFDKSTRCSATQSSNMATTNAPNDEAGRPKVTLFWFVSNFPPQPLTRGHPLTNLLG